MSRVSTFFRRGALAGVALAAIAGVALSAGAQTAAPNAGRQAVETRQAVLKLIANSFRPFGEIVKGTGTYDAAETQKRLTRLTVLSEYLKESFPDASNLGEAETKAKPEIWANRADFDKKLGDFQTHIATLVQVNATDKAATDGFKAAVGAVAQDCKGCHETYRAK